ncbi:nuclear transport factor 2 family protein [Streptomyces olivaceoviridis]
MQEDGRSTPPRWVIEFFREIDTLEFGPGFASFTDETEMHCGAGLVLGVEAIKAAFAQFAAPLETTHKVIEYWDHGRVKFLRGEAVMAMKHDPDTVVTMPLMHLYIMSDSDETKVRTIRVTAGPLQLENFVDNVAAALAAVS